MIFGVVKFFNAERGFGFVRPDDGSADAFVHASTLQRELIVDLREGDRVEFERGPSPKSGRDQVVKIRRV
jgi:cold shock protein